VTVIAVVWVYFVKSGRGGAVIALIPTGNRRERETKGRVTNAFGAADRRLRTVRDLRHIGDCAFPS
jgi:hypothetical protein